MFNDSGVPAARTCLFAFCASLMLIAPAIARQAPPPFSGRVIDERNSAPIAGATVTIGGISGSVRTDKDGKFTFEPSPTPPFQVVVVLAAGQVARPVLITAIDAEATIKVNALADESVTVVGAAPSIDAAPGAATTLLSNLQITGRAPENLMQVLETVPGINQVSEGHAAVPAIRGMARGRVLLLIDGARVTSERRVGPSATFLDPAVLEGVDVARGPGSVAYGSDALGGVISMRTRNAEPNTPLQARGNVLFGAGTPDRRGAVEVSKGFAKGGILVEGHARGADDWSSPQDDTDIFNSGWQDGGFLIRGNHQVGPGVLTAGWQSDYGRDIERPRNNSQTVRFYYPYENSHRFTTEYALEKHGGVDQIVFTGFLGAFDQRTDQDRYATATAGRSIERADVSANDFHVKGVAQKGFGRARLEFGLDINGRYDLSALDIIQAYDLAGNLTRDTVNVSIDDARRTDVGAFLQADALVLPVLRLSAGIRGDNVTTRNSGGYFGDRSTSNGAFSGFAAGTVGPFSGLSVTAQVSRGFRDPTLSDRYFRGPSGRGFITGNPDLEPETSLQFDLSARYTCRANTVWRLLLRLSHRRPDRALFNPDRFLFLQEPRRRPHQRLRNRDAHRSRPRLFARARRADRTRGTSRRWVEPGRHLIRCIPDAAAEGLRTAGVRPGPNGVPGRRRPPWTERNRCARRNHPGSCRRLALHAQPRTAWPGPQSARRRLLRQP